MAYKFCFLAYNLTQIEQNIAIINGVSGDIITNDCLICRGIAINIS